MINKVKVNYISCWDGCDEVVTSASLNLATGDVEDIESVYVSEEYENCTGEFVQYEDGTIEQVMMGYRQIIISKSEEDYKIIELHGDKYIVSDELNKDDIHRILGIAKES